MINKAKLVQVMHNCLNNYMYLLICGFDNDSGSGTKKSRVDC